MSSTDLPLGVAPIGRLPRWSMIGEGLRPDLAILSGTPSEPWPLEPSRKIIDGFASESSTALNARGVLWACMAAALGVLVVGVLLSVAFDVLMYNCRPGVGASGTGAKVGGVVASRASMGIAVV